MKQVRVHGPRDVRVDEVDEPEVGPRDALVRVAACGVCGTDLKYIKLGGLVGPGPEPLALGHELAGVVEALGAEVEGVRIGDRVVVHPGDDQLGRIGSGAPEGGLSPHLLVRGAAAGGRLHLVPDDLPLDVAALAEPLAVGINAVDRAQVASGDPVAVFGCGPIGLTTLVVLADRGHDQVVAVDLSARRRELALALGAQAALDPTVDDVWSTLRKLHGSVPTMVGPAAGTRAYIEASGAPSVIRAIIEHARPEARIAIVALHYDDVPVNFLLVLIKQLTIRGAMEYPERFEAALELLARRDLAPLITHRYPIERFADALETLTGSPECGKVMITID